MDNRSARGKANDAGREYVERRSHSSRRIFAGVGANIIGSRRTLGPELGPESARLSPRAAANNSSLRISPRAVASDSAARLSPRPTVSDSAPRASPRPTALESAAFPQPAETAARRWHRPPPLDPSALPSSMRLSPRANVSFASRSMDHVSVPTNRREASARDPLKMSVEFQKPSKSTRSSCPGSWRDSPDSLDLMFARLTLKLSCDLPTPSKYLQAALDDWDAEATMSLETFRRVGAAAQRGEQQRAASTEPQISPPSKVGTGSVGTASFPCSPAHSRFGSPCGSMAQTSGSPPKTQLPCWEELPTEPCEEVGQSHGSGHGHGHSQAPEALPEVRAFKVCPAASTARVERRFNATSFGARTGLGAARPVNAACVAGVRADTGSGGGRSAAPPEAV